MCPSTPASTVRLSKTGKTPPNSTAVTGWATSRDRPALTRSLEDEHAVPALLRLSREYAGELTLIALGPLTNIAAAIRLDPDFPARIKQFVFMGGTIAAHGNTPIVTAEYNIYTDPEAAYIAIAAFAESTMLSWETTLYHGFAWDKFNALCAINTVNGRFFRAISQETALRLQDTLGRPAYLLPDPLAMAITLRPSLSSRAASATRQSSSTASTRADKLSSITTASAASPPTAISSSNWTHGRRLPVIRRCAFFLNKLVGAILWIARMYWEF